MRISNRTECTAKYVEEDVGLLVGVVEGVVDGGSGHEAGCRALGCLLR